MRNNEIYSNKFKTKLFKSIVFSICIGLNSIYPYSLVNAENKHKDEMDIVKTKEELDESAQKAVKSGEVGTWITGLMLPSIHRFSHGSGVVNNNIYIFGGEDNDFNTLGSMEMYNPDTNTWQIKANMPKALSGFATSVVNGKIYCIGGSDGFYEQNTLYVYDPTTNKWETKSPMTTKRRLPASTVINGKIYVMGGNYGSTYHNSVEVYDPETDTWETKASMPTARRALSAETIDGKIYAVGGYNPTAGYTNILEVYDPLKNEWETKTNMSTARSSLASAVANGKMYCFGGYDYSIYIKTVEVYDPTTDKWNTETELPVKKCYFTSDLVNGKIYILGGDTGGSSFSAEAYVVSPGSASPSIEQQATEAIEKAEQTNDPADIENAKQLIDQLEEGDLKNELLERLNSLLLKLSSNLDVYIRPFNKLSMSIDTNQIVFENFNGIDDIIKENCINITINSSLPYSLNAYLISEIQNSDKTKTLNKEILNIKENTMTDYQIFTNTTDKLVLKDNNISGENTTHRINLKLKGGMAFERDEYKTLIKFEAVQK